MNLVILERSLRPKRNSACPAQGKMQAGFSLSSDTVDIPMSFGGSVSSVKSLK